MNKNIKAALIIGGIIAAIIIILLAVLGLIWGWQGGGQGMMMAGLSWWWFPIFTILFWGLVVWGLVALARGSSRPGDSDPLAVDAALEVLKERHVRSELNKEDYPEKGKGIA